MSRPTTAEIQAAREEKGFHWTDFFKSADFSLPPRSKRTKPVVFVAMSGGVDSSVAAHLLQQEGYQVVGIYMKNWSFPIKRIDECPQYRDYQDVVAVCNHLNIPYVVVSFEKEYRKRVINDFFKAYQMGLTPNPDVLCNREIKFDLLLKEAIRLGADFIATGHHIQKSEAKGEYRAVRGVDPVKDQTYFTHTFTQGQLKKSLFPIGKFTKQEVREIARSAKLPTAEKRDSQGICFIGKIDAKEFLKTELKEKTGDIVDRAGNKLGEHEGAWFYTIGQRRIAGLSGTHRPLYVIDTDVKNNLVIVGEDKDTYSQVARIEDLHLVSPSDVPGQLSGKRLKAKSRYTPDLSSGTLKQDKSGYYFQFSRPERAVTPGQSLVLYRGNVCIGGGVITSSRL